MKKSINFVVGVLIGSGVGLLMAYLFAPAADVDFTNPYQSRLDKALAAGKEAAAAREAELHREFLSAKQTAPGSDLSA